MRARRLVGLEELLMTEPTGTLQGVKLVMWNTPPAKEVEFRPTIEATRRKLREAGLPDRYAEDIADTTAFRRAADQCRAPDIQSRCFKGADRELYVKIDKLTPENDSEGATLRQTNKGVWKHTICGPVRVRGYDNDTNDMLTLEYETAKTTYEYADIGRMLMQIITKEGLGIYSPRRAGGVYFVPTDDSCSTLIERLSQFCTSLDVRLLVYAIPDTDTQRHEIGDAIAAGISVDVAAHREAIEAYTVNTRPESLSNRRNLMAQTAQLLIRLSTYLNGHAVEFGRQLDELERALKSLEAEQAAHVPSGRRVLAGK